MLSREQVKKMLDQVISSTTMSLPIYRPLMTLRLLDHSKICMYLYNFRVEYQAQSMTAPCSKKTAPYPKSHTQNCATINELEIEPTPTISTLARCPNLQR